MLENFIKTIKEKYIYTLIMCIVVFLTLLMYVSLFPAISSKAIEFEKLMAQFPKELWEVFGVQNGVVSMSTLEKYLSVEMFSLLWPILAIVMFVNFGIGAVAAEVENGTIELLLSLPISRIKILLGKILGSLVLLISFCFLSTISTLLCAKIFNIEADIEIHLNLLAVLIAFVVSGFSITLLFSVIFDKAKASMLASGVFVAMYLMKIVATLNIDLEKIKYASLFYYADFSQILATGKFEWKYLFAFLFVSTITLLFSIFYFDRRDISV
jgi:ABC-2 type transport system permease protein